MARPRILEPLADRDFAILWSGQLLSQVGDSVFRVALILFVVRRTGSAGILAAVTVAFLVPNLLSFLVAGFVVDRVPRRSVLVGSDAARALCLAALAWVASRPGSGIGGVMAVYAAFGVADAFFQPAYVAIVPDVVPAGRLVSANSLVASGRQVSLIVGPVLGAVVFDRLGASAAFWIDALTFAVSVASLLLVSVRRRPERPQAGDAGIVRTFLADVAEGGRYVMAVRWLAVSIAVAAILSAGAAGAMDVGLPFLVRQRLHAGGSVLGAIYAAQAVGAFLAAVTLGQIGRVRAIGIVSYSALVLMGLSVLLTGAFTALAVLLALGVAYGVAYQSFGVLWSTALQTYVPDRLLGRVSSVDYLGSFVLMPLGTAGVGLAVQRIGPAASFAVTGAAMLVAVALGLASRSVRRLGLDRPVEVEPSASVAAGPPVAGPPVAGPPAPPMAGPPAPPGTELPAR